jgi:hypothetical protein
MARDIRGPSLGQRASNYFREHPEPHPSPQDQATRSVLEQILHPTATPPVTVNSGQVQLETSEPEKEVILMITEQGERESQKRPVDRSQMDDGPEPPRKV